MFCFADKIEGLSPGHSLLENFEGLLQRAKGEDGGVFATRPDSGHKLDLIPDDQELCSQGNPASRKLGLWGGGNMVSWTQATAG